jgi:flavodoxin
VFAAFIVARWFHPASWLFVASLIALFLAIAFWDWVVLAAVLVGVVASAIDGAKPLKVAKDKVAVVYFSWSPDGNTRFAAETIAAKAGAKLFAIEPEEPYPAERQACEQAAKAENEDGRPRPIKEVAGLDLARYDAIIVGTPVWLGTMAPPVRAWLMGNAAALAGKIVGVFLTHDGDWAPWDDEECYDYCEDLLPGAVILDPGEFPGATIRDAVPALEKYVGDRLTLK